MLSKNIHILAETFSIENVSVSSSKHSFVQVREGQEICSFYHNLQGEYKCLMIKTKFDTQIYGILKNISTLFSKNNISIFAVTSIDYWYFFFELKFQKKVEEDIIPYIK